MHPYFITLKFKMTFSVTMLLLWWSYENSIWLCQQSFTFNTEPFNIYGCQIWNVLWQIIAMLLLRGLSLYTIFVGLSRLVWTCCCCCFFCQLDPLAAIYSCLNESSGITTGEALQAAAKVCRKYIYVITLPPYGSKWGFTHMWVG